MAPKIIINNVGLATDDDLRNIFKFYRTNPASSYTLMQVNRQYIAAGASGCLSIEGKYNPIASSNYIVRETDPSVIAQYTVEIEPTIYNSVINTFPKYREISFTIPDYTTSVIPLVKLTAGATSSLDLASGSLYVYRSNFVQQNITHFSVFNVGDRHGLTNQMTGDIIETLGDPATRNVAVQYCNFKYNNQWYGGISIRAVSTALNGHLCIKVNYDTQFNYISNPIQYWKYNTSTSSIDVLNQEIYDSMNTNIDYQTTEPAIKYNNKYISGYRGLLNKSSTTITPFSSNGGNGANTLLVTYSAHFSSGNSTDAGVLMIRCGYDGNNYDVKEIAFSAGTGAHTTYTSCFGIGVDANTERIKFTTTSAISQLNYIIQSIK